MAWTAPADNGGYPISKYTVSGCGIAGVDATPADSAGKVFDRTVFANCTITVIAANAIGQSAAGSGQVSFTPLNVSFSLTTTVAAGTAAPGSALRWAFRCPSLHSSPIETTTNAGLAGNLSATASRDPECTLTVTPVSGGPTWRRFSVTGAAGSGTASGTAAVTLAPIPTAAYAGGSASLGASVEYWIPATATIAGVTTTENSASVTFSVTGDVAAGAQCTLVGGASQVTGACSAITASGLAPRTTYNFSIRVPGADGQTRESVVASAVTKWPPPNPINLSVASVGQADAVVNFALDSDGTGATCTLVWNGGEQSGGCGSISFANRLAPGTAYQVSVRTTRDGISRLSGPIGFSTTNPPPPRIVTISRSGFTTPCTIGGSGTCYYINWSVSGFTPGETMTSALFAHSASGTVDLNAVGSGCASRRVADANGNFTHTVTGSPTCAAAFALTPGTVTVTINGTSSAPLAWP